MTKARLNPIAHLDALRRRCTPAHAFAATDGEQAREWQGRARAALGRCLAIHRLESVPLAPRVVDEVDRGAYLQRKVVLHSTPDSDVPVYLLLPKGNMGRRPCVLALHGHGYGASAICGITEDGRLRDEPQGYQRDFAVELVKHGFVVAAPEICCFGERESHYHYLPEESPRPSSCHNASTYALMLGLTMPGLRVWDGMRVVDYLETLEEADTNRLGVMGISGGGMNAFFSACMDERIRAAVISGYFCDWRDGILAINHCTCNFVPGLMELGELSDMAGLIAPRPLLVEHGERDVIFPIAQVKASLRKARRAWRVMGKKSGIQSDFFPDGHRVNGEKAYTFLQGHLGLASRRRAVPVR